MKTAAATEERLESFGEEVANSVSHGLALLAALVASPFLIAATVPRGAAVITGASVFAGTIILLYLASTLYHALPHNNAKRVLRVIDHAAIFLLIAGTYTPFTLSVLRGGWGWSLFGVVWGLAAVGVLLKAFGGAGRYPYLSTGVYVGMGWLVLIAIRPLVHRMPLPGLIWLTAGGIAYTLGTVFFTLERLRYAHFVFHLFVIAGTACHFVAVWSYAA